eukprot:SAG22_NODE_205_length_15308_cov_20.539023_20_plen_71_part_00
MLEKEKRAALRTLTTRCVVSASLRPCVPASLPVEQDLDEHAIRYDQSRFLTLQVRKSNRRREEEADAQAQ